MKCSPLSVPNSGVWLAAICAFDDPELETTEYRRAYFDQTEASRFGSVKEGDIITVEGKPSVVELRASTDFQPVLWEYRIDHSLLQLRH